MSKEQVYDAEINPLMAQVIAICKRAGIACFCTFDVSTGEEGDEGPLYCTTCLPDETGSFPDGMSRAADAFTGADRLVAMTITTSKPGEPDR